MPAEHLVQFGFLQVMYIHFAASCSMTVSMFSRLISVDGRGTGFNISKRNYFHAHVVYYISWWRM